MADDETTNPKTTSSDYQTMSPFWEMVCAIIRGAEALRARSGQLHSVAGPVHPVSHLVDLNRGSGRGTANQSPYLPQFENESALDYELRRRHAPLTNIYADISKNLASKPFSRECSLADDEPDDLKKLSENIDGQGNNLHVFARETFKAGLDKAITWILVDYTKVPAGATLAAERDIGARPYWVHIQPERMLAVYSDFINGREVLTHARIYEPVAAMNGYAEAQVERVRVLNREAVIDDAGNVLDYMPATWELYEEQEIKDDKGNVSKSWVLKDQGVYTIGIIPLVPYITGERDGVTWRVEPPLRDIAHMQIEEFQQESNLKTIKELTAFPMLSGNGVSNDDGKGGQIVVPVGPRAVLFAPMGGDGRFGNWTFIEPSATSLTFLQSDLEKLRTEMRNLGMQPLTEANLTVVTTANVAAKAHNAVQAWALGLKDSLEQAWKITCMWLGQTLEPQVNVHTDFGVDLTAQTELDSLLKAEAQGILSKETVQAEFKRRGVLSDDFDPEEEAQQLAEEQQGLQPEIAIDPVTGEIVQPSSRPKIISPPPVAPPVAPAPKPAPQLN